MPITIGQSNQTPNGSAENPQPSADAAVELPTWLLARRARGSEAVVSNKPPVASPTPPPVTIQISKNFLPVTEEFPVPQSWLVRCLSNEGFVSVAVSLGVHVLVLLLLAFIIITNVSKQDVMNLTGVIGNSDELTADLILDSELPSDAGESAPLQTTDASQALQSLGTGIDIAESMRIGMGGQGQGEGESGTGTSSGVASLNVPGHAQVKGSFSAWADPRDPKPGQDYSIVIQIKLPDNITKYRGSDISGNVVGTDSYRQTIRFKPNDLLPIEDGTVQIRIAVPGAARLVRDTIRVESKVLREKQTFEIEF